MTSIWDRNSINYKKFEKIWNLNVPECGSCTNKYAEIFRIITRIYYGLYKNGDWSIYNGNYHHEYEKHTTKHNLHTPADIFIEELFNLEKEYDYIDERNIDENEYVFNSLIESMDYEDKLKYAEEIINDIIIWTWNILADLYPNEYNNYS